jgi:hypothetical protein
MLIASLFGLAASFVRADCACERELVNVHPAARDGVIPPRRNGGNADDGLLEIFVREADRIKHGAGSGAFWAVHEDAGERAHWIRVL